MTLCKELYFIYLFFLTTKKSSAFLISPQKHVTVRTHQKHLTKLYELLFILSYDMKAVTKEWSIAEKNLSCHGKRTRSSWLKIQCPNHWAKESTPWLNCQRLNIYLQAMRNPPRQIIEGRSARSQHLIPLIYIAMETNIYCHVNCEKLDLYCSKWQNIHYTFKGTRHTLRFCGHLF